MKEALSGRRVKFDQQFLGPASIGRLLQVTYAPECDERGTVTGFIAAIVDITDRKQAEAALRESEERLRLFIEHAPAAIAMFDRQMRYVAVSRRWLADYDLGEDMLGSSHYDVFPDIPERWRTAYQQGLAGVVMRIEEDRFERSDGTVYWLRWEIRPWRDKSGGIGGIIIFAEDITSGKMAEDALRESEAQHRATFENAAVGIAHVGLDGRWLRCNDALCALMGYSREELLTKTFAEITHPDDIEPDWSAVRRLLAGETETFSLEKRYIRKDGSLIWGHLTVSLLRDAQGAAQHFISIVQDIQSRKEAQAQLRQLADGLEQRVEARTRELADTQDKLRALTTELNLTEHRIRKQLATDLHDYLAQLLVLSRIKLGQAKLEEVTPAAMQAMTEVQEVMDRALAYTRTLVAQLSPPILNEFGLLMALRWLADQMQRELTVTLDLESEVLPLSEEQSVLLFQSVRELLMNIVKHAGTTEAKISLTQARGVLRICVSDRGVGCEMDGAETQLEPRFGLFSIRERMKALGGAFDMQSVPGEGTTAILQLPVVQPGSSAVEAVDEGGGGTTLHAVVSEPASPEVLDVPATASPKIRVLLVDDHRMLRQGLRTIVDGHPGLEVVGEACDGLEAIELTRALTPAVVVMDVNMPRCDGVVATRRIMEEHPNIKVVALSMHNSPDIVARMKQAGAHGYLTKESAGGQLCRAIVEAALSGPSGSKGAGADVSCGAS